MQPLYKIGSSFGFYICKSSFGRGGDRSSVIEKEMLQNKLQMNGFDIIEECKAGYIEKIKSIILYMVHQEGAIIEKRKPSDVLADELVLEYSYLSAIFSEQENGTIEKYFILQKIERIKGLIS